MTKTPRHPITAFIKPPEETNSWKNYNPVRSRALNDPVEYKQQTGRLEKVLPNKTAAKPSAQLKPAAAKLTKIVSKRLLLDINSAIIDSPDQQVPKSVPSTFRS